MAINERGQKTSAMKTAGKSEQAQVGCARIVRGNGKNDNSESQWWARPDLNRQSTDYESGALTVKLRAL